MKFSSAKIREAAADHIEMVVSTACKRMAPQLESPIEVMLLEAVLAYQYCSYGKMPQVTGWAVACTSHWTITPQASVANYRVDFVIEDIAFGVKVAVECDGHDFHERTKEQARKDRNRDRDLQAKGYLVLRYTGSEIWRDPWGCAVDIEEKIWEYSRMRDDCALAAEESA